MHADELRVAVTKIVSVLKKSEIRSAVDQYRAAKGDNKSAAAAKLAHAGAVILEEFDALPDSGKAVVKCLQLDPLATTAYWKKITEPGDDPKAHQGEVVRLARAPSAPVIAPAPSAILAPLEEGEGGLYIRLTDAGERASDPDRIARAVDGVDMLYSACASIARKPAIDLRLDALVNRPNRDRDMRFTGERDSIAAVFAVIESIPAALANINAEQEIDLDSVVRSLPIFADLKTLAKLGTFSAKDLKDISETMHQGALLTLESGVILINESIAAQDVRGDAAAKSITANAKSAAQAASSLNTNMQDTVASSAAEKDEHYNRYLREREAMLRPQDGSSAEASDSSPWGLGEDAPKLLDTTDEDSARRDAVDELLKSLSEKTPER